MFCPSGLGNPISRLRLSFARRRLHPARGETFYSENLGRLYLRQAISTYLTNLHQLVIATDRIAVTASGVSALMLASQLLISPGDRVVTVTPLWPNAVEIPKVVHWPGYLRLA